IIPSMTKKERQNPELIDGERRQPIAKGSGKTIRDVNDLLKQFQEMRKITGRMGRLGMFGGKQQALEALSPGALSSLAGGRSLYGSKKKGSKAQQKKKKEKKKKRRR
ncbi:MAG: signal recognition particle protein, partial [Planctomycetes bacterium]|nr:signal recognition particle protein [Planctomycetota bacterium]